MRWWVDDDEDGGGGGGGEDEYDEDDHDDDDDYDYDDGCDDDVTKTKCTTYFSPEKLEAATNIVSPPLGKVTHKRFIHL